MHLKGNLGAMKKIKNKSVPHPKLKNNDQKSILIVDDDEQTLAILSAILRAKGYQPSCVQGGEKALNAVIENDYDLVITDIMMPEKDGFEVAKGVKIINPRTKIIFVSALQDGSTREYAITLPGYSGFLVKPFSPNELQELVEKTLE